CFSDLWTMVPFLGHGIGLRTKHLPDLLEQGRRADWFEVITENFLNVGGRPRAVLESVRRDRPVVLHGVSLSIGSAGPLDGGDPHYVRAPPRAGGAGPAGGAPRRVPLHRLGGSAERRVPP